MSSRVHGSCRTGRHDFTQGTSGKSTRLIMTPVRFMVGSGSVEICKTAVQQALRKLFTPPPSGIKLPSSRHSIDFSIDRHVPFRIVYGCHCLFRR
jgi:hypothetical protein